MVLDHNRIRRLIEEEGERFRDLHPTSARLASEASDHLLGGVPMPWMTRWPGAFPITFDRAEGAGFVDVDGIRYVDFCLGDTGAMAGHALPQVADAVAAQARRGITTMLPSEDAAPVAAELASRFGLPVWQIAMTATDANRFALRLARSLTGRRKVLVFDWCYHGTLDESLATLDGEGRVGSRPGSVGAPVDPSLTTEVVQFNDVGALEAVLRRGEVAAVLAEPALTNIGIILPDPGFHEALRRVCDETGTLLVIDETHTICAGPGGATAAWGLRPDLLVIGKTIGGGVPAAAYGMTRDVADRLGHLAGRHDADVSGIGGTLTGNALALAAVRATLSTTLRQSDFDRMIPLATAWTTGVQEVIDEMDLPWCVQQLGARAEYWFRTPPRNGRDAAAAVDAELDEYLHLVAINEGILMTPFHNMALMSPLHTVDDVDAHTTMFRSAVARLVDHCLVG